MLHHEQIGDGAKPVFFLHGIYGSGRNWGSVARKLVGARPELAAYLLDLRQHGDSQGFAPPHTIGAAADDLRDLAAQLGVQPYGVLGHSFGGKVALEYARRHANDALEHVWIVDSTPATREPSGSAWEMLQVLRRLPDSFASRQEGVATLQREGVAAPVASWMALNLEERDGAWHWRFDLQEMEALLRDFFACDLWPVLEQPPARTHIHMIKADESSVLDGADLERVERLANENGRVDLHRVAGGHWVNADNPDALHEILAADTSSPR